MINGVRYKQATELIEEMASDDEHVARSG